MNENLEKFLQELGELTHKYGLEISGCGCCGSPTVSDLQGNVLLERLTYNAEDKKYY